MRLKSYILTLLLAAISFAGYGQGRDHPIGQPTSNERALGKLSADSLLCAAGDTLSEEYTTRTGHSRNRGLAVVDGFLFYFDGDNWVTPATGSGGGITLGQMNDSLDTKVALRDSGVVYVTPYYHDSAYDYLLAVTEYLSDAIDSVAGLEPDLTDYAKLVNLQDTAAAIRADMASAFDTTHIYNALADTAAAIRGGFPDAVDTTSLSNRINLKLNAVDTAGLSGRINLKMSYTDTAGLSGRINLKLNSTDTASLSNRIDAKGIGTITAITGDLAASGSGTVTGTLATVNATPATYGSTTAIPVVTVDAKGRVTLVTTVAAAPAGVTTVTGTAGRVSSTGGTTPVIDLVTVNATPATYGSATAIPVITVDGYGRTTTVTTVSPGGAAVATVYTITVTANAGTVTATNSKEQTMTLTAGSVADTLTFAGFTNTVAGAGGHANSVAVTVLQGATPNTGGLYLKGSNFGVMANGGRMPFTGTTASSTAIVLYLYYNLQTGDIIVEYDSDVRKP